MRLGGSGHNTQNPSATRQCLKLEQGLIQSIESARFGTLSVQRDPAFFSLASHFQQLL